MKRPVIARPSRRVIAKCIGPRHRERGITIALVALAIVAIMAMAALSIDVVTLYLANAEAQRSADAAALAAARVLSLSGMTGDPQDTTGNWAAAKIVAQTIAQGVANQNVIGGAAPNTVTVTFLNDGQPVFGENPVVQVKIQRTSLPTFFSRIWGRRGATVGATAVAEAFNPSNSATYAGSMVPVQPRCVKPWIIANIEPQTGNTFVSTADGSITNPGIQLNYAGAGNGVIGEEFTLTPYCNSVNCANAQGNFITPAGKYIPASIQKIPAPVSIPNCATSDPYQEAIAGCDQNTVYSCGAANGITANADLTFNPGSNTGGNADTSTATQCLINQGAGADQINTAVYPFEIEAGGGNPLIKAGLPGGDVITASNNIVTIPIMDNLQLPPPATSLTPAVTIVGFLQAFVQRVDVAGNPVVTILNVSGCSNGAGQVGVSGSSPVPVRLVQKYP
ncbi:MAG TPA: pilus assembly protein TadG-related protein [Candidatus Sulfotelmatobacter sp.]